MHDNDTLEDVANDLRIAIAARDALRSGSRERRRAASDVQGLRDTLASMVAPEAVPSDREVQAKRSRQHI